MSSVTAQMDEQIQKDVLDELHWDEGVQATKIGVAVKDGIVTLTGVVDSWVKRWAAEQAAHRVHGVKAVVNEIEVHLPGSSERTDTDIAKAASSALKWDILVPRDKLSITVSEGWVKLEGAVSHNFQRKEAERVIRHLAGVKGITNLIQVKPKVQPTNVKHGIEQALIRSAALDAEHITVEVEGSKVILKGTVRSYAEWNEAASAAWSAPGVTEVDNRLRIESTA